MSNSGGIQAHGLEKKAKSLDMHVHFCGFFGCKYTFVVLISVTARSKSEKSILSSVRVITTPKLETASGPSEYFKRWGGYE